MALKSIGIRSETDRLTRAALAGLPSVEQELLQLHPTNKSLFLDHMDVLEARNELKNYAATLGDNGVDVIIMKEELAKLLSPTGQSTNEILCALFDKADAIKSLYSQNGSAQASSALRDRIAHHMDLDAQIYGEDKALALAKALCLDSIYPLGNIIYARDQTNVVFGNRIIANMQYKVRKAEVAFYEAVYQKVLRPHNTIKVPQGEIFEGGSLYVHSNTVFIDVDPRTTLGAALHIFSELSKDLGYKYPDLKYAIVKNGGRPEEFKAQQDSMHLDTFSMPVGDKQIAVCEAEAEKRSVYLVQTNKDGSQLIKPTKKTFIEYLQGEGYDVIAVSKDEQNSFGCNILVLDSKTAFMPISDGSAITAALREKGKKIITVPMSATTNGFGATHCAVGQLERLKRD